MQKYPYDGRIFLLWSAVMGCIRNCYCLRKVCYKVQKSLPVRCNYCPPPQTRKCAENGIFFFQFLVGKFVVHSQNASCPPLQSSFGQCIQFGCSQERAEREHQRQTLEQKIKKGKTVEKESVEEPFRNSFTCLLSTVQN